MCAWPTAAAQPPAPQAPSDSAAKTSSIPLDQQNARQAHDLLEQAIQALGGEAYLNIHDMQEQGRTYTFYHGRPSSNGVFFWRFLEFPGKERIELTGQRDVAYVYNGTRVTRSPTRARKPSKRRISTTTCATASFLWKRFCIPG